LGAVGSGRGGNVAEMSAPFTAMLLASLLLAMSICGAGTAGELGSLRGKAVSICVAVWLGAFSKIVAKAGTRGSLGIGGLVSSAAIKATCNNATNASAVNLRAESGSVCIAKRFVRSISANAQVIRIS